MGKSRRRSGAGEGGSDSNPNGVSPERRAKLEAGMKQFFDFMSEDECKNFVDSVIEHNFEIDFATTPEFGNYVILKSKDPNNNDTLYIDEGFFRGIQNSKYVTMRSVLNEYEDIPIALKNGQGTSIPYSNSKIIFSDKRGTSGLYYPSNNDVLIPTSTLNYPRSNSFSLSTVLVHEMTHRADYEQGTRFSDASLIGGTKWDSDKLKLSAQPKFRDIGTREVASAYSRSYKYTPTGRKTKKQSKVLNYDTENLSETMTVTHMIHKYGMNVRVEDPSQSNRNKTIPASEWVQKNPELYEIGERLYDAKSYDEFKAILYE